MYGLQMLYKCVPDKAFILTAVVHTYRLFEIYMRWRIYMFCYNFYGTRFLLPKQM